MSNGPDTEWPIEKRQLIGDQFVSLGRVGFYLQLVLLVVPLLLVVYIFLLRRASPADARAVSLGNYISFLSTLVMMFTTYWFYRYIRLGERTRDPARTPPRSVAVSTLWVGFWAGWLGIVLSMLLLFAAAWRMMFVLLSNPQSGMILAPTLGTNPTYSISAIDAVTLSSLVVSLGAELLVLGLTLWLLFRVTWPSRAETKVTRAIPV
jgi:hypothetical protein